MLNSLTCFAMLHQQELHGVNELRDKYNDRTISISGVEYELGTVRFIRFVSKSFDKDLCMYSGFTEFTVEQSTLPIDTPPVDTIPSDTKLDDTGFASPGESELESEAVDIDEIDTADFTPLITAMIY